MKSIFKFFKYSLYAILTLFFAGLISLLFVDTSDEEVTEMIERTSPSSEEVAAPREGASSPVVNDQIDRTPPTSNLSFGSVDKHVFRTGNNRGNTVYVVAVDGINDSNILNNAEKADLKVYGRKRPYTDADFVVHVFFYDSPDIPNLNEFSDSNTGEVLDYINLEHSKKPFAEWRRYVMSGSTELIVD